jgi:hypothetical protein
MVRLSPRRKPPSCPAAMASMTERVLILDFGSQYTQLIGGKPQRADGPEMAGLDFPVLQC